MIRRSIIILALVVSCVPSCAQTVGVIGNQMPKPGGTPPPPPVPTDPSGPSPSDGATGQSLNVTLTWVGCSGATAYGVKYGTTNPPSTDSGALGSASFSLNSLSNSTTYYWQPYCSNASGDNPGKATPTPIYSFTTTAGAPAGVVSQMNLSAAGCFVTYGVTTGPRSTDYPVTFFRSGGVRHYLQMSGSSTYGDIFESTEPTLKACSTDVNALNLSNYVGTYTMTQDVQGSQQTPGNGGVVRGLYYDNTATKLYVTWSGQYTNLPSGINTIARYAIDTTAKTLTREGCWAPPHPMPYTSGGIIDIPASFGGLPAGARLGLTGGLFASATSGNLYGPSIEAITVPSNNACAANTDNGISAGTVLARFLGNTTGPYCTNGTDSGPNLLCTPTQAPTNPHPAYLAFTDYSYDLYTNDWERYGTPPVGFFADYVAWRLNWYNDGVKAVGVVPFTASEGALKTTISASPAPTMTPSPGTTGSVGTMRLGSTSTNFGGRNLHVGDFIGVNMCIRDVDAGCTTENQKYMGIGQVSAVNTGTGDVTFTIVSPTGCTSCNNTPIVGGPVYGGPIYVSATPGWMRSTLRMQLIDPAQWSAVVSGGPTYGPIYNEEFSLYDMGVTTLGDAVGASTGIRGGFTVGSAQVVSSVIVDPTAQQIVIFIDNVRTDIGISRSLGIVLNVSHTP